MEGEHIEAGRSGTPQGQRATASPRKVALRPFTLGGIIVGAFLLGLLPMWWTAYERGAERDDVREELSALERENTLAAAALLARQGEYDRAREAASQFFTEVNQHVTSAQINGTPVPNADALRASLSDRDEIITLLARSDPASADRLADLYMSYTESLPPVTSTR